MGPFIVDLKKRLYFNSYKIGCSSQSVVLRSLVVSKMAQEVYEVKIIFFLMLRCYLPFFITLILVLMVQNSVSKTVGTLAQVAPDCNYSLHTLQSRALAGEKHRASFA